MWRACLRLSLSMRGHISTQPADTFPNTVLEALACGTPLAATSVGGIPEQAGDTGLLFDPKNKEDMAEKIYRIWIDEDLRKQLIQKDYGKIKAMTLENYARQWEMVIEEAMKDE